MYNIFRLLFLVVRLCQVEEILHPITDNIITVFILVGLDEELQMSMYRNSIKPEIFCCMLGGWSAHLTLHILVYCFFLHDRVVLVIGLIFLYLIISWFHDIGWLLRHPPRHFLPWMMGPFLFMASWHFILKQCWTNTIILVPCGT